MAEAGWILPPNEIAAVQSATARWRPSFFGRFAKLHLHNQRDLLAMASSQPRNQAVQTKTVRTSSAPGHQRCFAHGGLADRDFADWCLATLSLLVTRRGARQISCSRSRYHGQC